MRKNTYRVYSTAFYVIIGTALCADGLVAIRGGVWILALLVLIALRLVFIGRNMYRADQREQERRRRRRALATYSNESYYHGGSEFTSQINKEWRNPAP